MNSEGLLIDQTPHACPYLEGETAVLPTRWYAEDLSPMYLPMVERPADWTDMYNGGYLTESVHPRPLVKTNDRNHLDFLNNADISQPMAAVNQLQRVAWGINENVINTLLYCWESEIEIGDIPSPVGQKIPSKPHDIGENEDARRKWRKAAARIHAENTSNESKRLQMVKIFWMAKKFSSHYRDSCHGCDLFLLN